MICHWRVFASAIKLNNMITKIRGVMNLIVISKLRMRLKMMITRVVNMDTILTSNYRNVLYGNKLFYINSPKL